MLSIQEDERTSARSTFFFWLVAASLKEESLEGEEMISGRERVGTRVRVGRKAGKEKSVDICICAIFFFWFLYRSYYKL